MGLDFWLVGGVLSTAPRFADTQDGASIPPEAVPGDILVPFVAFYASSTEWAVEGRGVEPDIDVIDDPAALARGEDPQLEAAIKYVEGELGKRERKVVPGVPGVGR